MWKSKSKGQGTVSAEAIAHSHCQDCTQADSYGALCPPRALLPPLVTFVERRTWLWTCLLSTPKCLLSSLGPSVLFGLEFWKSGSSLTERQMGSTGSSSPSATHRHGNCWRKRWKEAAWARLWVLSPSFLPH